MSKKLPEGSGSSGWDACWTTGCMIVLMAFVAFMVVGLLVGGLH
jgi:hypothetical protein